jgi:methylthioribose-1-phosphate isomerase
MLGLVISPDGFFLCLQAELIYYIVEVFILMTQLEKKANDLLTVAWKDGVVVMIDQTKLPNRLCYIKCTKYQDVADAIRNMTVRGAPAIGISAAFGLTLAALDSKAETVQVLIDELNIVSKELRSTRPTAVNLFWGLERVMQKARESKTVGEIKNAVLQEALKMAEEDIKTNRQMGMNGSKLLYDGDVIMTHCNAGSLATAAYGTALGVIRAATETGKQVKVIVTETRPVMQGSRLTTFELHHDKIDVTLIPDTAVGHIMSKGIIKCVLVGADRILRTGHVFNKIGTYQIALIAKIHKVPFYVAAPLSTFDLKSDPNDVTIEERPAEEVIKIGKKRIAVKGVQILNPAFDITPPDLVTGIITERGIIKPPFEQHLYSIYNKSLS